MKTTTLLMVLSLFFFIPLSGQNAAWQWAKSAGHTGDDRGSQVVVDASGNVYVTGWYTSADISFGTTTLLNNGASDFFVVKYDPAGNVLWARNQGGSAGDVGYALSVDGTGNVYVAGWFTSPTLVFGSDTLKNSGQAGTSDVFVVKYDSDGKVLWSKAGGGTDVEVAYAIATDPSGNVYITGLFNSPSAKFGGESLINTEGPSYHDIFIVKYSFSGTLAWAKRAGGQYSDEGYGICVDSKNNLFLTGYFSSPTVTFGSSTLHCAGESDVFVAKYSALTGDAIAAKAMAGNASEEGRAICAVNGSVYVTGKFVSPVLVAGSYSLTNAASNTSDAFLIKYDTLLSEMWVNRVGAADNETAYGIAADPNGNVVIAGGFMSSLMSVGNVALANNGSGYNNIWLAGYTAVGNPVWADSPPGDYDDEARSVAVDANNNVYVTGKFNSATLTFSTINIYKGCGDDFFLAKMGLAVGLADLEQKHVKTRVYPNPSKGSFFIGCVNNEPAAEIEIYNVVGVLVKRMNVGLNGSVWVDLTDYPKGIYYYRIVDNSGVVSEGGKVTLQ